MIQQPLAHDYIIDHAKLQKEINTPICLDESIHSYEDARKAIELGSCKVINIKIGRVGGLTEAKRIHDLCREKDRKSTRLNSSHVAISYAVFCLKKKTNKYKN